MNTSKKNNGKGQIIADSLTLCLKQERRTYKKKKTNYEKNNNLPAICLLNK